MKRKLCSVLLSVFALLLLMGAGPAPEQGVPMVAEEERTASLDAVPVTDEQSESKDGEAALETSVEPAEPVEAIQTDNKLLIDGVPTPLTVRKDVRNGVTYVALVPMAQLLNEAVQVGWYGEHSCVVIMTPNLRIIAQEGKPYVEANGRFLYVPETVQIVDGATMLPLSVVAECFDAKVAWDGTTDVVNVSRGSGALAPADQYYDQDDLFWLSRVIYAESGNQCLEGKMSVGSVVMNRVASPIYPNTIQGVLAQKNQFSTYKGGRLAKRTPNKESVIAAKLVLDGGEVKATEDAYYFDSTGRSWASRHKECIAVIGDHYFYG